MRLRFSGPARMRFDGCGEIGRGYSIGLASRREHRGLVCEIGQVRSGEAGCQGGDLRRVHVLRQFDFGEMHMKNRYAAGLVRSIDRDLAIEAPGAQQGGIEDFWPVGGCKQHHADSRIETIELA